MILKVCFTTALLAVLPAAAQVFPLSENFWSNPEFMERFMGSYGAVSAVEPTLTREEQDLFREIAPLLEQGQIQQARRELERARTLEASAAIDFMLGNFYFEEGRLGDASASYAEAIRKLPTYRRAYRNAGQVAVRQEKHVDAIPLLTKAIELGAQDDATFGLLAFANLNLGREATALLAYQQAVVLNPTNKDWQVGLAKTYITAGRYEEATTILNELLLEEPDQLSFWKTAANARLGLQDYSGAARYLEAMRRLGLGDAAAYTLLADVYVFLDAPTLAVAVVQESFQRAFEPRFDALLRTAEALQNRGFIEESLKMVAQAKQLLKKPLTATQEGQRLASLEAALLRASGNAAEAIPLLESLVEQNPLLGEALMELARYYREQDDHETALYYLQRAEKLSDFAIDAFLEQARIAVDQGDLDAAAEHLQQAQAIRPQAFVTRYLERINRVRNSN